MSNFDFNNAEPQRAMGALIPDNTICLVVASLRPGGQGPGSWLKANNDGSCLMADFEFTIDGGEFDRRKFWSMMVTEGETDGQQKAANITRSKLRAMLESAFAIHPGDDTQDAVTKRQVSGWGAFDGLKFCAKIGVEQGGLKDKTAGPNSERWPDKNVLKAAITPDESDYINPGPQQAGFQTAGSAVQSAAKAAGGGTAAAVASTKPAWAS